MARSARERSKHCFAGVDSRVQERPRGFTHVIAGNCSKQTDHRLSRSRRARPFSSQEPCDGGRRRSGGGSRLGARHGLANWERMASSAASTAGRSSSHGVRQRYFRATRYLPPLCCRRARHSCPLRPVRSPSQRCRRANPDLRSKRTHGEHAKHVIGRDAVHRSPAEMRKHEPLERRHPVSRVLRVFAIRPFGVRSPRGRARRMSGRHAPSGARPSDSARRAPCADCRAPPRAPSQASPPGRAQAPVPAGAR